MSSYNVVTLDFYTNFSPILCHFWILWLSAVLVKYILYMFNLFSTIIFLTKYLLKWDLCPEYQKYYSRQFYETSTRHISSGLRSGGISSRPNYPKTLSKDILLHNNKLYVYLGKAGSESFIFFIRISGCVTDPGLHIKLDFNKSHCIIRIKKIIKIWVIRSNHALSWNMVQQPK